MEYKAGMTFLQPGYKKFISYPSILNWEAKLKGGSFARFAIYPNPSIVPLEDF